MTKIQVIGLPGSGKSYAIEIYKDRAACALSLLNLDTYSGPNRNARFRKSILQQSINTIAESACGVYLRQTFVIKLLIPRDLLMINLSKRSLEFDCEYNSYLSDLMIKSDYTVGNTDDLVSALDYLFR